MDLPIRLSMITKEEEKGSEDVGNEKTIRQREEEGWVEGGLVGWYAAGGGGKITDVCM